MRSVIGPTFCAIAVIAVCTAVPGAQQSRDQRAIPAVGTSSIVGTVSADEPNGPPLRRALITLWGSSLQRQTATDDKGRFAFLNLPAGTYSAPRASKGGYVPATYGQKRLDGIGIPITLAEGQRMSIAFRLLRGAVITGTVLDNGRPFAQTSVTAVPVRMINGVRSQAAMYRGGGGTTDDRGVYRMFGLAPGDYVVSVTPRMGGNTELRSITDAEIQWAQRQVQPGASTAAPNPQLNTPPPLGPAVGYTAVYFPGTTDPAAATLVTLTAGQERSGVDISVSYVTTAKLEGTILDPDGQPAQTAQVNLVPLVDMTQTFVGDSFFLLESMMFNRPTVVAGKFSMAGVRPGSYTLAVRGSSRPAGQGGAGAGRGGGQAPMNLWASTEVTVTGEDQSGIVLRLQQGMELSGRVVFEPGTLEPPRDLSRMQIRLASAPTTSGISVSVNVPSTAPETDGSFTLEGVSPGRYLLSASQPATGPPTGPQWTLKSAKVGDIDAADLAFEVRPNQPISDVVITFTDKASELSGTLLDAAGHPTTALSIILFSTDKNQWAQRSRRFRSPVRAGTDGKFKFTGLLPGEYYLAALGDFDQIDVYKPEFLEQVAAAAMKITLVEGEKKVQDLKIAGGG